VSMTKKPTLLVRLCPLISACIESEVMSAFLRTGVPINKLDCFCGMLEENGYRLAGRHPMSDIIPFILVEEKQRIQKEMNGRDVSVMFDGTSRHGEVKVCLCFGSLTITGVHSSDLFVYRYLQRLRMCGEEIARELITTRSTELSILPGRLLASMRDRVVSNGVVMHTLKIVYPT